MNVWGYFSIVYLRGRNFRVYSPLDSGVVGVVVVGVFLFALVRPFFGGVWTDSVSFVVTAAAVVVVDASFSWAVSTSIFCSSFDVVDFFPFGVVFVFFAALTGGDDDASRFFPALVDALPRLRGVGVFFFVFTSSSSSSAPDGMASWSVGSLTSSIVLLPI